MLYQKKGGDRVAKPWSALRKVTLGLRKASASVVGVSSVVAAEERRREELPRAVRAGGDSVGKEKAGVAGVGAEAKAPAFESKDAESESDGTSEYDDLWKEVDDLHSVLLYFSEKDYETSAVVGHSKGGSVVVLYASKYADAHTVINISGCFDFKRGIENVLGQDYLQRIKIDGFIDVMDKNGKFAFRVTEQSLMDILNFDMHAACLSIDKKCRLLLPLAPHLKIFTVHGSADEINPVEDAYEFAKVIPNHKLHIIEGANHFYTKHQEELAKVVVNFLASVQQTKQNAMLSMSSP
ncbi:hypothetical protein ZIOFF_009780 [Zingiber officinale]|uniref:Serine aminopeptidase S33 domain-containing protein n=1 Tax=Zingiber officinale TaxID=94328 RepID=A0A8J5HLC7_ZINOF|nr:hypothetical protein ZIOFF_009780 [Zingiber officinale]